MERRRSKSNASPASSPVAAPMVTIQEDLKRDPSAIDASPKLLRRKTGIFLNQIQPALRTFYWTIAVRGVSDISTAEQTFQAQLFIEYYVTLTPEEERDLQEHCKTKGSIHWVPQNRPRLTFMNEKEILNESNKETQFYELKTGEIMCMIKDSVQVLFNEALELENFPFDVQDLTMTFGDYAGDLRWSAVPMTTQTWFDIVKNSEEDENDKSFIFMTRRYILDTEWNWLDIAVDFDFDEWDGVTESTTYVAFKVERQWVYYFWRVYFVLAILSFLAMFPLRLAEDERPDQLAFISTILLTAFVYQVVLSQLLPKLPYLTILDQYVLFTLIFCVIVGLEIMVPLFYGDEWHVDYKEYTNGCMYTDLALWASVQLYHVYLGWSALQKERHKVKVGPLHEFRESEEDCFWIMDIPNEAALQNTCFLTKKTTLAEEYANKGGSDDEGGDTPKAGDIELQNAQ